VYRGRRVDIHQLLLYFVVFLEYNIYKLVWASAVRLTSLRGGRSRPGSPRFTHPYAYLLTIFFCVCVKTTHGGIKITLGERKKYRRRVESCVRGGLGAHDITFTQNTGENQSQKKLSWSHTRLKMCEKLWEWFCSKLGRGGLEFFSQNWRKPVKKLSWSHTRLKMCEKLWRMILPKVWQRRVGIAQH